MARRCASTFVFHALQRKRPLRSSTSAIAVDRIKYGGRETTSERGRRRFARAAFRGDAMKIGEMNVGESDQLVRAVLGLVLVAAFVLGVAEGVAGYLALLFGVLLLATAAFRTCWLYSLIGISTAGRKKR